MDFLHTAMLGLVAFTINEALIDPLEIMWQTPAMVTITLKKTDKLSGAI